MNQLWVSEQESVLMGMDQNGLNSLLAGLQPKSNLSALRDYRAGLWNKLRQAADRQQSGDGKPDQANLGQDIKELSELDKKIAQEVYDEETKKLETERLKLEELAAKNGREKERALAKHERVLQNASMRSLLSAAGKISAGQPLFSSGAVVNSLYVDGKNAGQENSSSFFNEYTAGIDRDLKESVQYGIAAAEVSVRRKKAESKAQIEEAAQRHQAERKKKAKHSINIMV